MLGLNEVVAEDKKLIQGWNLSFPAAFEAEFDRLMGQHELGEKAKWQLIGAALLLLFEAGEEGRADAIDRIQRARGVKGSFAKLLAEAKAAGDEADRVAALARKGSVVPATKHRPRTGQESPQNAESKSVGR